MSCSTSSTSTTSASSSANKYQPFKWYRESKGKDQAPPFPHLHLRSLKIPHGMSPTILFPPRCRSAEEQGVSLPAMVAVLVLWMLRVPDMSRFLPLMGKAFIAPKKENWGVTLLTHSRQNATCYTFLLMLHLSIRPFLLMVMYAPCTFEVQLIAHKKVL